MRSSNPKAARSPRRVARPYFIPFGVIAISLLSAAYAAGDTYVTGDITAATDYVSRGVSQTMSGPALQGSLGFANERGLSGFVWASNVDYVADGDPDDGARTEIDLVFEYEHALTDRLTATVSHIRYFNPGVNPGLDYDYSEWWGTLSLDARHRISLYHSNDIFGTGARALYYAVATSFELPAGLALELEAGRFDLRRAWGEAYNHATLALSGDIDALSWRVAGHLTGGRAREMFYESIVEPRLVLSVSYAVW